MTQDEAVLVLKAAMEADGGCCHCVLAVIEKLYALLPQIRWLDAMVTVVVQAGEDNFAENEVLEEWKEKRIGG